jgi:dipeptidyl aminopeptidase/acylaminoacyl peptidase
LDNLVFEVGTENINPVFSECQTPNFHDVNSSYAICLSSGLKVAMAGDTTVQVNDPKEEEIGSYTSYLWVYMVETTNRTNYISTQRINLQIDIIKTAEVCAFTLKEETISIINHIMILEESVEEEVSLSKYA